VIIATIGKRRRKSGFIQQREGFSRHSGRTGRGINDAAQFRLESAEIINHARLRPIGQCRATGFKMGGDHQNRTRLFHLASMRFQKELCSGVMKNEIGRAVRNEEGGHGKNPS